MAAIKTILHITPFYSPNIGGVETHLLDLTEELVKNRYNNIVLTYSPLTTDIKWKKFESVGNTKIYRFAWYGHGLFNKFEKFPILNFLYLTPYLLSRCIFWQLYHRQKIDVIHSHGLNAAIIGNLFKALFSVKKHVTSIYSSYDNVPLGALSMRLLTLTLNQVDVVLTQSNQSLKQLLSIGVSQNILFRYHHWIDLSHFKPEPELSPKQFTVLFVGRMIPQKNALLLAEIAKKLPKVAFTFVGTGPDYFKIKNISKKTKNITLVGDIPYNKLHTYYQSSSILCIPSKYSEGWGRVIMESVACGTPAICSSLGATVEAVDHTVARFILPSRTNLIKEIQKMSRCDETYNKMKLNCRKYALIHFSNKNVKFITEKY